MENLQQSVSDMLNDYELGKLNSDDTLKLFGELIRSGKIWELKERYIRRANGFIEKNIINEAGIINWELIQTLRTGVKNG